MASTRSIISPPPFAEDASTVIPPTPIAGVSYRDPVAGPASSTDGWPYGERVNSAEFNQIMFQLSTIVGIMDKQGILGWSDEIDYGVPAMVFGSNGLPYIAIQSSGPNSSVQDPVGSPTHWEQFASTGRIVLSTVGTTSWTVPMAMQLGYIKPFVRVIGGGGGGGKNDGVSAAPSGGGGGGIAESVINLTGVTSVSVTVGNAGAGSTANGFSGTNGGSSTFLGLVAGGGLGGAANGLNAGFGGLGTGGSLNSSIGAGSVPYGLVAGGFGGGGESPAGAAGAAAPIGRGQGGAGRITTSAANGAPGVVVIDW